MGAPAARSAGARARPCRLFPSRLLAADGHAARQEPPRRALGARPRPVEAVVNAKFWAGKRVFLTGHTGFKGSWLALWLSSLGARVSALALPPPTSPSLWGLIERRAGISSTLADIRDAGALAEALDAAQP